MTRTHFRTPHGELTRFDRVITNPHDRLCGRESLCALHVAWGRARDELTASLRTTTVADLTAAVPG
jgi:DNA-binding IscR family transcriptional regulator